MKCNSKFIYSEEFLNYHFHPEHPFNQQRVLLTKDLLEKSLALTDHHLVAPRMATEEELALFHDQDYITAVQRAGRDELSSREKNRFGLGTEDTPVFPNMHEASSLLVGGALTAVESVLEGDASHALHLGGGLHHGFKRMASGFSIYNDAAVAINYIREKYDMKVLYVDTDAHHGDGVQDAFYDNPHVCTLSIHETGRYLFPGTGRVTERGIEQGHGYSFNIPLDAFTQDESFLHIYASAFKEIADYFKPDIIITQNGADAHHYDPLTHLCTSMKTYEQIPVLAHEIAHEYCDGKWIALGGGGYDIWKVVPRAWAQIWNVMHHGSIKTGNLPTTWREYWQEETSEALPLYWHDTEDVIPTIPRKEEIEEINELTLQKSLKYIKKNL